MAEYDIELPQLDSDYKWQRTTLSPGTNPQRKVVGFGSDSVLALYDRFCFKARLDSSQSAPVNDTKVLFATEVFDLGSQFDAANRWLVPTTDGYWLLKSSLRLSTTTTSATKAYALVFKNGSSVIQRERLVLTLPAAGTTIFTLSSMGIHDIDAGDHITVYLEHDDTAANLTIVADADETLYQGLFI